MGGILRGVFPLEAGFEEAQPLATFWNLCSFRVPGNDILALDEVQTVLYTHMVITRFLYRSAGLNERQSLPKKAKVAAIQWLQFRNGSGQLSGYDMPRNVDPSVKKGVGLKQLAHCSEQQCGCSGYYNLGLPTPIVALLTS